MLGPEGRGLDIRGAVVGPASCQRLFRDETNVARFVTMVVIRTAKEETAIVV